MVERLIISPPDLSTAEEGVPPLLDAPKNKDTPVPLAIGAPPPHLTIEPSFEAQSLVPKIKDAAPEPSPLIQANTNMRITNAIDPAKEARLNKLAKKYALPMALLRGMDDATLTMWENKTKLEAAAQAGATSTVNSMAQNPKNAVEVRDSVAEMAVMENAISLLPPPTPTDYIEGLGYAAERGWDRLMTSKTVLQAQSSLETAQDIEAGRTPMESFFSGFVKSIQSVADSLAFVIDDPQERTNLVANSPLAYILGINSGLSRAGRREGTDEKDAVILREQAESYYKEALKRTLAMQGKPMSDRAQRFMSRVRPEGELDDGIEKSLSDELVVFMKAMVADPIGFGAMMSEIGLEFAPVLGAGAATTLITRTPAAGMAIATAGTFVTEAYQLPLDYLKKRHGVDLNTEKGFNTFVHSPDIQRDVERFGSTRGAYISAFQLLGIGAAGRIFSKNPFINTLIRATIQSGADFIGETGAQLSSEGVVVWMESILEAALGPATLPVDIAIATVGHAKKKNEAVAAKKWLETGNTITETLKKTPTAVRDMATAADILGEKLESQGVTEVFIDAKALIDFEQSATDEGGDSVLATLGLSSESVHEAALDANTVRIDATGYVRHILGVDGFNSLIEHTKTEAEGMTPAEAKRFEETGEADLEAEVERLQTNFLKNVGLEGEALVRSQDDASSIHTSIRDQLVDSGQVTVQQAELYALLKAQRYTTRAIRASQASGAEVRALDLYLRDAPKIVGPEFTPAQLKAGDVDFEQLTQVELTKNAQAIFDSLSEQEKAQVEKLADRLKLPVKDVIARSPLAVKASRDLIAGTITQEDWNSIIDKYKPVTPFENVPSHESDDAILRGLAEHRLSNKKDAALKATLLNADIADAIFVGLRLDIPSYKNEEVWTVTVHEADPTKSTAQAGTPLSYQATARVVAPEGGKVKLSVMQPGARKYVTQELDSKGKPHSKSTFATIRGNYASKGTTEQTNKDNEARAKEALNTKGWVQVGMDPERHSYFYDRSDHTRAIVEADEVIQVGALVLAKNPVYATPVQMEEFLFQAPRPSQVDMRIRQLAFENDVRSGQVTVTEDNIVEVNQLREELGLTPLELTPTDFVADKITIVPAGDEGWEIIVTDKEGNEEGDHEWIETKTEALKEARKLFNTTPTVRQLVSLNKEHFEMAGDRLLAANESQIIRSRKVDTPVTPIGFEQEAASIQAQPIDVEGTGPGGRVTNWDFGEVLTQRHLDEHGRVLDVTDEADRVLVLDALQQEYDEQTAQQDDGEGWYVEDIAAAIETTKLILPELHIPANRDLFLTLAALLSPQEKPTQNWEKAVIAMELFLENGIMPDKKPNGKGFGVNASSLPLIQHMIDTLGGIEQALEWIRTPKTGKEIAEMRMASGVFSPGLEKTGTVSKKVGDFKASEVAFKDTVLGIYAFGPKVGDFMMNSTGFDPDAVTVDLWLARTYNRNIGRILDVGQKLRENRQIVSEIRGKKERALIKGLVTDLAKDNGITPSAMQAALWYFEQRLFRNHGINSESTNFSGAAEVAAEKREITIPRAAEAALRVGEAQARQLQGQPETLAPLEQDAAQGPRGRFIPSDTISDQDGNPINIIQIFETGDRTTFLHESGHFWLEQLKSDAAEFGGELKVDFDTVTKWWGDNADSIRAEALDRARKKKDTVAVKALSEMSDAKLKSFVRSGNLRGEGHERFISVAMHEQWARGTENYFRTGEAPSLALADAFVRFAAWMKSVYRSMLRTINRDGLDIKFSPEVKEVLDRMLASDQEIETTASQFNLVAMFETAEQAGMTKEKFATYQRDIARAREAAKARQTSKRIKEIERQRLDWWKNEREALRGEVESELASRPAHRLIWTLAQGGLADGSTAVKVEKLGRIDRAGLLELMTKEELNALPKAAGRTIFETSTKKHKAVSPGVAAQVFGFDSVQQMIEVLKATPDFKESVEAELDRRMVEEHGTLEDDAATEAIASIHEGDDVGRMLSSELSALRTSEKAFSAKFVRAYAIKQLLKTSVRDLNPGKFLAAEKKHATAAGRALKAGNRAEAYKHKFQQRLNHIMAREAIKLQKKLAKDKDYLVQFKSKRRKFPAVDADYIDRIQIIMDGFTFGPRMSERTKLKKELAAINEWIEKKKTDDQAILDLSSVITEQEDIVDYRDMPLGDFDALVDGIKVIEKQGRLKKKLLLGQELLDRNLVVAKLLTALRSKGSAKNVKERGKHIDAQESKGMAQWAAGIDATLLKLEMLFELIDGTPLGPWHQAFYQPFADAEALKQDLNKQVADLIHERIQNLPKKVRKALGKRIDVGVLALEGEEWTRGNLIMLALNVGNESNRDKVIRGEKEAGRTGISEETIDEALEHLTKEEWEFVQAIWDHSEKLFPEVERIYRRENGRGPLRIEPREISNDHGTFRGGYFPLMYDHTRSQKADDINKQDALEAFQSENVRASVNSSVVKERVQAFAAPVDFSINRLGSSFERTIHFISHYEAVQNAKKLLADPALIAEMQPTLGPAYINSIKNWVGHIAANGQDRPPVSGIEAISAAIARNTTVATLGFSYTTMAAQLLGYTAAFDRLLADTTYGPVSAMVALKDIGLGLSQALSKKHRDAIFGLSGEMRHRLRNTDRDLRAGIRAVQGKAGLKARVEEYSMLAIGAMQLYTVDLPVWSASYNRALRAEPDNVQGAINYADRVVRISQSAGGLKDLADIQRDKGAMKVFTMFYSFFSVLYAILRQVGHEVVLKNPRSIPRAMARILILLTLQEIGYAALRGKLPDLDPEDEEEDALLTWAAKKTVLAATGTVPLLRDMAEGVMGDYGYKLSPIASFGDSLVRSVDAAADAWDYYLNDDTQLEEPIEFTSIKPIMKTLGVLLRLPTNQPSRTLDGLLAIMEEEEGSSLFDLLVGFDEEQAKKDAQ